MEFVLKYFYKFKSKLINFISSKFDQKISFILFFISISFLIFGFIIFDKNLNRQKEDFRWIEETYQVVQNLNQLKISLFKIEKLSNSKKKFNVETEKFFQLIIQFQVLTLIDQKKYLKLFILNKDLKKIFILKKF